MRLVVGLMAACSVPAAWKAGVAVEKITPKESIWLAGYAAREKPSESVRQDIYAKALALEDGSGAVSVIVTMDLVGIRRDMAEAVAGRIREQHSIPRERILFNASHTHSAPLVTMRASYASRMGQYAARQQTVIGAYSEWLSQALAQVVANALKSRQAATLSFDQGFAGFAVNRRRVGHREYPGPVDHDVPVLAVRAADGSLKAILFGYACHNTVMGDYTIHGDYAGYAQHYLQDRHPGAVALFVQGAGADANPLPRRKPEHLERYGATLADAVDEVLARKMKSVNDPLHAAIEFPEVRFAPRTKAEFERKAKTGKGGEADHARRQLEMLAGGGRITETYPYAVQAWKFGDSFTLLALAGEVVVDYSLRFKAKYGWDTTWVAGYSNDVFGYIPSLRVLKEGGYEGGGAFLSGSFPGPFAEDIEDRIAAAVDRVRKRVHGSSKTEP
jgi:hypothetical protein